MSGSPSCVPLLPKFKSVSGPAEVRLYLCQCYFLQILLYVLFHAAWKVNSLKRRFPIRVLLLSSFLLPSSNRRQYHYRLRCWPIEHPILMNGFGCLSFNLRLASEMTSRKLLSRAKWLVLQTKHPFTPLIHDDINILLSPCIRLTPSPFLINYFIVLTSFPSYRVPKEYWIQFIVYIAWSIHRDTRAALGTWFNTKTIFDAVEDFLHLSRATIFQWLLDLYYINSSKELIDHMKVSLIYMLQLLFDCHQLGYKRSKRCYLRDFQVLFNLIREANRLT